MSTPYIQRWLLCSLKKKLCEFSVAEIGVRPARCARTDKGDGKLTPTGEVDNCPDDKEAADGR